MGAHPRPHCLLFTSSGYDINRMVFLICIFGWAIFCVGALAGLYMMIHTGDWTMASVEKYKQISADQRNLWPIYCVYICIPLGILIAFAAILSG
jgi:hypothetical protein